MLPDTQSSPTSSSWTPPENCLIMKEVVEVVMEELFHGCNSDSTELKGTLEQVSSTN